MPTSRCNHHTIQVISCYWRKSPLINERSNMVYGLLISSGEHQCEVPTILSECEGHKLSTYGRQCSEIQQYPVQPLRNGLWPRCNDFVIRLGDKSPSGIRLRHDLDLQEDIVVMMDTPFTQ